MDDEGDFPGKDMMEEYLGQTGAVELLCEINVSGSQFSRLAEALEISRGTLTRRLEEGEDVGVIETIEMKGRGTSHAYALTETGAELRVFLDQSGTTEKYQQIKRLQQEFDERTAELREWVTAKTDRRDPPQEVGWRRHLQEYSRQDQS